LLIYLSPVTNFVGRLWHQSKDGILNDVVI